MIEVSVKGADLVDREMAKLGRRLGMDIAETTDRAAAVAQKRAVGRVQPFGVSGKAKLKGEKAIVKDLHYAFKMVGKPGRGVIDSEAEAERYHRQVRVRGRVPRSTKQRLIYAPVFKGYLKKVLVKVGTSKGAFAERVTGFDNKFQKWIMRHSAGGDISKNDRLGKRVWEFSGEVPGVALNRVFGPRNVQWVLKGLKPALRRSLEGSLRRQGKKVRGQK